MDPDRWRIWCGQVIWCGRIWGGCVCCVGERRKRMMCLLSVLAAVLVVEFSIRLLLIAIVEISDGSGGSLGDDNIGRYNLFDGIGYGVDE